MFAFCIESSHSRGMGHLYRALNLADALLRVDIQSKFYINNHQISQNILNSRSYLYEVVDLLDFTSGWENKIISHDKIRLWINDRLNTDIQHAERIKDCNVPLVTFDDRGTGANLADLHIAALVFEDTDKLAGKTILNGVKYLILDPDIKRYRHLRTSVKSILVTLGGSDTYGVTIKIVELLAQQGKGATIVIGPGFEHEKELEEVLTPDFTVKCSIPSLIEEFSKHDLAITCGGITSFEANASGVPCIVVANELFEIPVGKALASYGGAFFAGYYTEIKLDILHQGLPIETMSQAAMDYVKLDGCHQVVNAITRLGH
jgi:spore coat polysaccharide biosynthesis predicted glycosyltransferase SpsG